MSLTHQTKPINDFYDNFKRMSGSPIIKSVQNNAKCLLTNILCYAAIIIPCAILALWLKSCDPDSTPIFSGLFISEADAAEISEQEAIGCILGEARGEGYQGMLAVAEAMRNRGRIKGVDGCFYIPVERDPVLQAHKAWKESKNSNITNGADHWHADYINPWWAKYGIKTAKIGKHIFYKKVVRK